MSPNLPDFLHHVIDEADYLSVEAEDLSREEFLSDE